MRFTRKDVVATVLVAVAVLLYIGFVAFEGFWFIDGVPAMAGVGLLLGFASRRIGGREGFAHDKVAFAAGLGSITLGIVAVATESELLLALFMLSMVGLWLAAMYAHSGRHVGHVRVLH
jgi:hypothetical protein